MLAILRHTRNPMIFARRVLSASYSSSEGTQDMKEVSGVLVNVGRRYAQAKKKGDTYVRAMPGQSSIL